MRAQFLVFCFWDGILLLCGPGWFSRFSLRVLAFQAHVTRCHQVYLQCLCICHYGFKHASLGSSRLTCASNSHCVFSVSKERKLEMSSLDILYSAMFKISFFVWLYNPQDIFRGHWRKLFHEMRWGRGCVYVGLVGEVWLMATHKIGWHQTSLSLRLSSLSAR